MVEDTSLLNPSLAGLETDRKADEPCTIVIFGASGDLTARKLIPALFHLYEEGQMPESFRVVGFARREKTDASWRAEMREGLERYSRTKTVDGAQWEQFAANLAYHQGDLTDAEAYAGLAARLTEYGDERLANNLVFYLAISPSLLGRSWINCTQPRSCGVGRKAIPSGSAWWWRNRSGMICRAPAC